MKSTRPANAISAAQKKNVFAFVRMAQEYTSAADLQLVAKSQMLVQRALTSCPLGVIQPAMISLE